MNNHKYLIEGIKERFGDLSKSYVILEESFWVLSKYLENNDNDKLY